MIIVNKRGQVPKTDLNDVEGVDKVSKEVLIGHEENVPTFVMRRFSAKPNGHTPFHKHDWEHEVYVLEGEGSVRTFDDSLKIRAGDSVFVPPNEKHQFLAGKTGLTFLCIVPKRGDPS